MGSSKFSILHDVKIRRSEESAVGVVHVLRDTAGIDLMEEEDISRSCSAGSSC